MILFSLNFKKIRIFQNFWNSFRKTAWKFNFFAEILKKSGNVRNFFFWKIIFFFEKFSDFFPEFEIIKIEENFFKNQNFPHKIQYL